MTWPEHVTQLGHVRNVHNFKLENLGLVYQVKVIMDSNIKTDLKNKMSLDNYATAWTTENYLFNPRR